MKKLLVILFSFFALSGFSQVYETWKVPHYTGGRLNDTLQGATLQNEATNGMAGLRFISQTDTAALYYEKDTLIYQFDDGTQLKVYENGDSIVFSSSDSILIDKIIMGGLSTIDTARVALNEVGTAAHYADSAWVNFVKVNDTIWVPRIELGSNADNINGKITFIASDNDQCVDSINTSDQRVFADAARYDFSATIKTPEIFTEVFYVTNTGDTTAVNTWRYKLTGDDLIIERRNAGLSWIEIMRNSPD